MAKRKAQARTTGFAPAPPDFTGPHSPGEIAAGPSSGPAHAADLREKSRSQKKRESTALQHRGEELAALSPALQAQLPLTPDLAEALALWRGLKSHEAKRRHLQYIGRLMREADNPDDLLSALENLKTEAARDASRFARLEGLRDALLDPAEAVRAATLERTLGEFPALERTRLLHLMEAALADREKKRPPRHSRELFRYLRDGRDS